MAKSGNSNADRALGGVSRGVPVEKGAVPIPARSDVGVLTNGAMPTQIPGNGPKTTPTTSQGKPK